jgi:hypothetical protein
MRTAKCSNSGLRNAHCGSESRIRNTPCVDVSYWCPILQQVMSNLMSRWSTGQGISQGCVRRLAIEPADLDINC